LVSAERAAREHNLDFVAVSGGVLGMDLRDPKRFVYDFVGPDSVDALLICTHIIGHHSTLAELTEFVARFDSVPRVCLGVALAGVTTMLMDNETGMFTAVKHLVETHRFRRIAFVAGPEGSEEAQVRYRGYQRALAEGKLAVDPRYVVAGNFTRESGARAVATLFTERGLAPGDLDAIVCADDLMALGALDELDRRGLNVPRQIALTGFDDTEFARYARVPLTTVRQPVDEQIRHAVAVLAAMLQGCSTPTQNSERSLPLAETRVDFTDPVLNHRQILLFGPIDQRAAELAIQNFEGIIALHADDTSDGLYGYAHGRVLNENLLIPALHASEKVLPRNHGSVIDGFAAWAGVIGDCFKGVLAPPPEQHPRPFEIIFETPARALLEQQVAAAAIALETILAEYRGFIAYAADL